MPPKNSRYFGKPKTLSAKSENSKPSSGKGDGGKQITISKFFANAPKRKAEEKADNEDVTIIIDDAHDKRDNVKEKKVSSPLKKKPRRCEDVEATSVQQQSTLEPKQPKSEKDNQVLSLDASELLTRTKEKLNAFAANEETEQKESIETFYFNCLKRDKAKDLQSYSQASKDTSVINQPSVSDESAPSSSGINTSQISNFHNAKLAKFSSKMSGKKDTTDSPKSGSRATKIGSGVNKIGGGVKYTQLEQQVVDIKEKYSDTVLLVECGYKYRFFGNDAEIAAEVLKIFCHQDHNFMTASIPVHRLFVHVRRLVSAGHKVGVVKQMETAALKAAGGNKGAPFARQLTALYTKSTLIGEDVESGGGDQVGEGVSGGMSGGGATTNYLMCVCDHMTDKGSKEQQIGIMAVQLSTGDIVYDSFEDKEMRVELETILVHLQPVEVLVSQTVSSATDRLLTGMQAVSLTSDDRMRIEHLDQSVFDYTAAFRLVSEFYQREAKSSSNQLQEVVHLPKPVICCLAALITYLRDFNLEKILLEVRNFTQFSTQSKYMQLNSCTLRNLEIFRNSTDGGERGSLFWAVNQTVSRPGAQMLRSWMSRPLMDYKEIMARQTAVSDILAGNFPDWQKIQALMSKLPDLQKALTAVYHKKCGTADFYNMCKALQKVHDEFAIQKEALHGHVTSDLLREIIQEVPDLLTDISEFASALVEKAAKENDKTNLFVDESRFPSIVKCKCEIADVLREIQDHRRDVRLTLHQPSLEYTSVSGTEFLVEVKNKNLTIVPKSWTKISSTKAVSRFHTPVIVEKYKVLQQCRERLEIVCQQAWQDFLDQFVCQYQCHRKAVQLVATLDCLFCLASVAQSHGYCRPEIVKEGVCIEVEGGRHPVIEDLLGEAQQYVPNDTHLNETGQRVMIITGPNMGGKSSYIKQVAIISLLAQMGSYVPAHSARLGILDAVFTRMGASDEIFNRRSTFMVELQEAADIMAKVTSRSLVILDELGRGTSTHDGTAIAHATLEFFITEPKCMTLFVTHYPLLAEFETANPDVVANFHMSFMVHNQQDSDLDKVTFLYQLATGVADRSYGLNVARLANMPETVVKVAGEKSQELEEAMLQKRQHIQLLMKLFSEGNMNYKDLLSSVT